MGARKYEVTYTTGWTPQNGWAEKTEKIICTANQLVEHVLKLKKQGMAQEYNIKEVK